MGRAERHGTPARTCADAQIRCSYVAKDHLDQIATALCCAFSPDGQRIVAGASRALHVFDACAPGQATVVLPTSTSRRARDGQPGPVSSLAFRNDVTGVLAAGCFSGTVGVYDTRVPGEAAQIAVLAAHRHGVTQVCFAEDGWHLYSAARTESEICQWDLRTGSVVQRFGPRASTTHQRLYFDVGPARIATGNQSGDVLLFDLSCAVGADSATLPTCSFSAAPHPVSCVAAPLANRGWLATTSGERHFALDGGTDDEDDGECKEAVRVQSTLCLWQID